MNHVISANHRKPVKAHGAASRATTATGLLVASAVAAAGLAIADPAKAATVKWEPPYQEPVPPDDPGDVDTDPDGTASNPLIKAGNWWDGQGADPGNHAFWGTVKNGGNQAWTQDNQADFPNYYFDGYLRNQLNVVGNIQVARIFMSGANTNTFISSTSGGTLEIGASEVNSTGGTFQIDVPVVLGAADIEFYGYGHTINGIVSDGGNGYGFVKAAQSNWHATQLNAINTYTGQTLIESGRLTLGSGGDISSSAGVTILTAGVFDTDANSSATVKALEGTGSVSAHGNGLTVSELLSPGDSAGTLNFIAGSLTLGDGAAYDFEIDGDTASPISDRVDLNGANNTSNTSGTVRFAGDWTLTLSSLGTVDPAGLTFVLFEYGSAASADPTNLGNWSIDYGSTGWGGGMISVDAASNQIVLSGVTTAVPEPASLGALLLGATALFRRARRRASWS